MSRRGPQRSEDTRRKPGAAWLLTLIELDSAVGCHGAGHSLHWVIHSRLRNSSSGVIGRVRLAHLDAHGVLVRAPVMVVRVTRCSVCGLSFV
jgi:hypothetical protein